VQSWDPIRARSPSPSAKPASVTRSLIPDAIWPMNKSVVEERLIECTRLQIAPMCYNPDA
jgi:hypothetical protein